MAMAQQAAWWPYPALPANTADTVFCDACKERKDEARAETLADGSTACGECAGEMVDCRACDWPAQRVRMDAEGRCEGCAE